MEDLADEEVALLPPTVPPAVYDLIVPPCTPSGRPIRRTQPVQTIHEILSLVARGLIVHPTSSTVPIFGRDDIILIPVDGMPPIPLGLVWCTSRENPRIRALDDVARSMIRSTALMTLRDSRHGSDVWPPTADGVLHAYVLGCLRHPEAGWSARWPTTK